MAKLLFIINNKNLTIIIFFIIFTIDFIYIDIFIK
jgi:hypothetical protein